MIFDGWLISKWSIKFLIFQLTNVSNIIKLIIVCTIIIYQNNYNIDK